jgi:hypothetical protein
LFALTTARLPVPVHVVWAIHRIVALALASRLVPDHAIVARLVVWADTAAFLKAEDIGLSAFHSLLAHAFAGKRVPVEGSHARCNPFRRPAWEGIGNCDPDQIRMCQLKYLL